MPKILVITADKPRHMHFAAVMAERFGAKVIVEMNTAKSNYTSPLMKRHFEDFERTEQGWFGQDDAGNAALSGSVLFTTPPKSINDPKVLAAIKEMDPELILVYGTSIIGRELIASFPGSIINVHAGLSPYYRGSGCNVYPFLNNELEYVGVTIHFLDEGVDSGDIILQGRPAFEESDNTHTIGCKTAELAAELMAKVVERRLNEGKLPSLKPDLAGGRICMIKDFTDEVVGRINRNVQNGIVRDYIRNPKEVDIVEW